MKLVLTMLVNLSLAAQFDPSLRSGTKALGTWKKYKFTNIYIPIFNCTYLISNELIAPSPNEFKIGRSIQLLPNLSYLAFHIYFKGQILITDISELFFLKMISITAWMAAIIVQRVYIFTLCTKHRLFDVWILLRLTCWWRPVHWVCKSRLLHVNTSFWNDVNQKTN